MDWKKRDGPGRRIKRPEKENRKTRQCLLLDCLQGYPFIWVVYGLHIICIVLPTALQHCRIVLHSENMKLSLQTSVEPCSSASDSVTLGHSGALRCQIQHASTLTMTTLICWCLRSFRDCHHTLYFILKWWGEVVYTISTVSPSVPALWCWI